MDFTDVPQWAQMLLTTIGASGAVYGGIRSDLKHMHEKIVRIYDELDKAHERIDELLRDNARNTR